MKLLKKYSWFQQPNGKFTLRDVEFFKPFTREHNGKQITTGPDDIAQAIEKLYENMKLGQYPRVFVGHHTGYENHGRAGLMDNIRMAGDTAICDIVEIPQEVFDQIGEELIYRSPEYLPESNSITGLALLESQMPWFVFPMLYKADKPTAATTPELARFQVRVNFCDDCDCEKGDDKKGKMYMAEEKEKFETVQGGGFRTTGAGTHSRPTFVAEKEQPSFRRLGKLKNEEDEGGGARSLHYENPPDIESTTAQDEANKLQKTCRFQEEGAVDGMMEKIDNLTSKFDQVSSLLMKLLDMKEDEHGEEGEGEEGEEGEEKPPEEGEAPSKGAEGEVKPMPEEEKPSSVAYQLRKLHEKVDHLTHSNAAMVDTQKLAIFCESAGLDFEETKDNLMKFSTTADREHYLRTLTRQTPVHRATQNLERFQSLPVNCYEQLMAKFQARGPQAAKFARLAYKTFIDTANQANERDALKFRNEWTLGGTIKDTEAIERFCQHVVEEPKMRQLLMLE